MSPSKVQGYSRSLLVRRLPFQRRRERPPDGRELVSLRPFVLRGALLLCEGRLFCGCGLRSAGCGAVAAESVST